MAAGMFSADEEGSSTIRVYCASLQITSAERFDFIDVTDWALERVRASQVWRGMVCVHTAHTTTAVVINENEPLLIGDMKELLERLAPARGHYGHNDLGRRTRPAPDESANGDSHCKAMLLGTSESLTVMDGRMQLGTWQRIFLVELDGPRRRTVRLAVLGVTQ